MKMAVKWSNLFINGHSIGVLELSFQGDLRFVSLNTYFKLVLAQSGIETAKMNQKNLAFTKVLSLKSQFWLSGILKSIPKLCWS